MQIETSSAPDPAWRKVILDGLITYNDEQTNGSTPARTVAWLLRGPDGAVEGGMWTVTYWDWMHVELFFVPEGRRGAGLGARLMIAAENEAVRMGCHGIWLDTASYQAPDFYQRHGFRTFGEIRDYVPPHTRQWMQKTGLVTRPVELPEAEMVVDPSPDDRLPINRNLMAYSDLTAGPNNFRNWAAVIRGADGVEGGLWARLGRGWLFVELLGLPPHARRSGVGTELMQRAEDHARAEGCRGLWLDTSSFQARPFYLKRGFTVFGQIEDQPIGHTRYFLSKRLDV